MRISDWSSDVCSSDLDGRATGVHYHREGNWRFQRAKNVVVAGYAIETPRLLLNSATSEFPDGLANSSGLVGKNLMVQLKIGRASCRESVCQYVTISVVAVSLK